MPPGIGEKLQLSPVTGIFIRAFLDLDYKKVAISSYAPAMVDNYVRQYPIGASLRIAIRDTQEALLQLPISVVFAVHIPSQKIWLQVDSKTMGR